MFTFPLNETYIAFGDGSSNAAGSFYGLVLIPESRVEQIEEEIKGVKQKFGGKSEFSIHCREIFGDNAREKSSWSHLSYQDVVSLCGEVLRVVGFSEPKYLVAHIPKAHYPKRFRLRGKSGHPDLVHDIDEKWLTLWAFFRIGGLLDPVTPIVPDDPKIKPRPRNLPFWNMVTKRTDPGLRVRAIYLDREKTKIRWISKKLQWISVARELVVENRDGSTYLPIKDASNKKPSLVDVADILTYSIARELEGNKPIDYGSYCGEVHLEQMADYGEEIVAGG
jgi:hypothetical protein